MATKISARSTKAAAAESVSVSLKSAHLAYAHLSSTGCQGKNKIRFSVHIPPENLANGDNGPSKSSPHRPSAADSPAPWPRRTHGRTIRKPPVHSYCLPRSLGESTRESGRTRVLVVFWCIIRQNQSQQASALAGSNQRVQENMSYVEYRKSQIFADQLATCMDLVASGLITCIIINQQVSLQEEKKRRSISTLVLATMLYAISNKSSDSASSILQR